MNDPLEALQREVLDRIQRSNSEQELEQIRKTVDQFKERGAQ